MRKKEMRVLKVSPVALSRLPSFLFAGFRARTHRSYLGMTSLGTVPLSFIFLTYFSILPYGSLPAWPHGSCEDPKDH
jgi:hypothetical protein